MSDGQLVLIVLGLGGPFRPGLCGWLRIADRLGQHEAQLILGHRWLPCSRCFPLCHTYLYRVPEGELKPGTYSPGTPGVRPKSTQMTQSDAVTPQVGSGPATPSKFRGQ